MKKLIICRGIPGSGKSYWAKQWLAEDPDHRVRINRDDIRHMMGKYWVPEREDAVTKVEDSALKAAMWDQFDIVVDNMNLNPKTIAKLENIVKMHNSDAAYSREPHEVGVRQLEDYQIEFKDFFTPLEVCIERDSRRETPIGEATIRQIWKKYKHDIWCRECDAKLASLKTYDSQKKNCILVDMDATLAFNVSHRPFYGEGCADQIQYDAPLVSTIAIVQAMKITGTCKIFIVTGRDESLREATEQWLDMYQVPYDHMYMREVGDYSKGEICKKKIYDEEIAPNYNVLFALDDDNKCADMYRKEGIICLQP